MAITLTQLRSFLAVVRSGSVTSAAEELVVTQPSISAAVRALTRELGTPLLERDGRGVRPTAAGRAFAPYATDIIGLLERGRRAAIEASGQAESGLRIAAVTTAAESFVPLLLKRYASRNPDVDLTLAVGNRDRVLELLLRREADIGFVGRPPSGGRAGRIKSQAVRPNELVLAGAPDEPLTKKSSVTAAELNGSRWLLREQGSGTRTANEDYIAANGLTVRTLTLGSNGAIKQAVRSGLGISFLARDSVAGELESGALAVIPLTNVPPGRPWHVMRSAVGPSPATVGDFFDFAVAEAQAPTGE